MARIVGYARVSTKEQVLDRQVKALKGFGVKEEFILTEKQSGKDFDRPVYQSLKIGIGKLMAGDELVIMSLDRLGRNKDEIQKELAYFKENKVIVRILDLPTTLVKAEGNGWVMELITNLMIELYSTMAEQERLTMLQRQKEGMAAMKTDPKTGKKISSKTGRVVGRPKINYPCGWEQVYSSWRAGEITAVAARQELGLKTGTFYNLVKNYEEEQKNEQGK